MVEVKNIGVDKGSAVSKLMTGGSWDFVLAVGDDASDETVFAVLPEDAYAAKVGYGLTRATFSLESPEAVRALLADFLASAPAGPEGQ